VAGTAPNPAVEQTGGGRLTDAWFVQRDANDALFGKDEDDSNRQNALQKNRAAASGDYCVGVRGYENSKIGTYSQTTPRSQLARQHRQPSRQLAKLRWRIAISRWTGRGGAASWKTAGFPVGSGAASTAYDPIDRRYRIRRYAR